MPQTPIPPVNPNAAPEARALLAFLYEISGQSILSGQHNFPKFLSEFSDKAAQIAGSYPAVWGQDFGFAKDGDMDGVEYRQAIVDEAKRQHAAGSIITLMWHAVRPTEDEPVTFKEGIQSKVTDQEWRDLLTPGTPIHTQWTVQVDRVCGFLAQLQQAHIPVLWRPYHEMNGDWFWWCGKPGSTGYAALWRQLYDRMVNHYRLDNLIWVWNANKPGGSVLPYPDFYPGHDVVDALATDIYRTDYAQRHHDDLATLAEGRPIALGEVGQLPTPEILAMQPLYSWFMVWTSFITDGNPPEAVRAVYDSPRTINRPAC